MGQTLIDIYQSSIGCSIDNLAKEIFDLVKACSKDIKIIYRVKDTETLAKKMILKRTATVFSVNDVYGFRVLTSSIRESYAVLEIIRVSFPSVLRHDFMIKPKTRPGDPRFAGKALRLLQVVAYKNNILFEIQITTFEFNASNELLHNEYHRRKYS